MQAVLQELVDAVPTPSEADTLPLGESEGERVRLAVALGLCDVLGLRRALSEALGLLQGEAALLPVPTPAMLEKVAEAEGQVEGVEALEAVAKAGVVEGGAGVLVAARALAVGASDDVAMAVPLPAALALPSSTEAVGCC